MGFPGGTSVKNPHTKAGDMRHGFNLWVGKFPWRRVWQPTPVFLPGKSHGQRNLVFYRPQGHTESDTTEATQGARTAYNTNLGTRSVAPDLGLTLQRNSASS